MRIFTDPEQIRQHCEKNNSVQWNSEEFKTFAWTRYQKQDKGWKGGRPNVIPKNGIKVGTKGDLNVIMGQAVHLFPREDLFTAIKEIEVDQRKLGEPIFDHISEKMNGIIELGLESEEWLRNMSGRTKCVCCHKQKAHKTLLVRATWDNMPKHVDGISVDSTAMHTIIKHRDHIQQKYLDLILSLNVKPLPFSNEEKKFLS